MSSTGHAASAEAPVTGVPFGALGAGFLAMCAGLVAMASFEFVVIPMQTELGFSADDANALTFMPAAASLLVVFIVGALVDRLGARKVMVVGALVFTLGAVVVGAAQNVGTVTVGRVLGGIGGSTMGIVGLAIINAAVTEPKLRARVFGIFAATVPAMFFLVPPLSAILVEISSWRGVTVVWAVLGLGAILAALRFAGSDASVGRRELLTPSLAGIALAGIALGITNISVGWEVALPLFSIGVLAAIALAFAMARITQPSLDLRWTRGPGVPILIIGMIAAAMPNLFFYTNLLLQYRYQESMLVIAVLLMIPQSFAVAGGLLSGPISARIGPAKTAASALLLAAVTSLSGLLVAGGAPIWVPVAVLALSAAPIAAAVGPITESLLNHAPPELSGVASSVRDGFWTLGGCVGGAIFGALAFTAFQGRLEQALDSTSVTAEQAHLIAQQIRGGGFVADIANRIPDAAARDLLVGQASGLLDAQSHAYAVVSVLSASVFIIAFALMLGYMRRSARV